MGKAVIHKGKASKVEPFHLMTGSKLPNAKLARELDTKWKPIFRKMMDAPGVKPIPNDVDGTFVQS